MNAYELADIIEDDMEDGFGMGFLKDAVSMIRQQADELNKVVQKLVKANGLIENLRIRIAELEKDGKVCATCGGLVYDPVIKQTKPLSDEEIRKIAIQCDAYDNDGSLITDDICIDKFARAIEERHGIK